MKTKIIIALLSLIVLFQATVIYNDKQVIRKMAQDHADKQTREMMEGYERCTAANDESHQNEISAGRDGKESDDIWLRARAYCRVNLGESLQQVEKDLNAVGLGKR
jgi:hypothetical protein